MRNNIERTRLYYDSIKIEDLCSCGYCENFYLQIKKEYPLLADYLDKIGVDIEKPHETSPISMMEQGYIEYYTQYVVYGTKPSTFSERIGDVDIRIAKAYPSTGITDDHFVLDVDPIRLKWIMEEESC